MPSGYVDYEGVLLTRREMWALEKEYSGIKLDHFDKQALERAKNKLSKAEKKYNEKK